jgi:hypothetical protein
MSASNWVTLSPDVSWMQGTGWRLYLLDKRILFLFGSKTFRQELGGIISPEMLDSRILYWCRIWLSNPSHATVLAEIEKALTVAPNDAEPYADPFGDPFEDVEL